MQKKGKWKSEPRAVTVDCGLRVSGICLGTSAQSSLMDRNSSLGQREEQRKAKQATDRDWAEMVPCAASGGSMWYRRRKMGPGSLDDKRPGS